MAEIFRNIIAVVVGLFLGSVVNMAIIMTGLLVFPLPAGVDMSNMENFAENLKQFQTVNFVAPWLAHALGTFVGAFLTALIAGSHKMKLAMVIAFFFLLGGISMVTMYGGPMWFILADLIGAYLPMGFFGGKLGTGFSGSKSK